MGIVVFIKKKLSELKLGDIFVVSVPYGDCSLYKTKRVDALLYVAGKFPSPVGIVVFININTFNES